MFVGKIFSAAVLGFTALAGIATASVVPAPAFDVKPRAEVNSTQAGLDIVTKFQTNVYGILPKLVDYDRAIQDTTPVFEALLRYYGETTQAIATFTSLPPVKDTDVPDPAVKTVDILNETLNSVNAVVNILNPTDVNAKNARLVVEKTDKLISLCPIIIPWPWPPIIIIQRIFYSMSSKTLLFDKWIMIRKHIRCLFPIQHLVPSGTSPDNVPVINSPRNT